jgi:hypothetical protein
MLKHQIGFVEQPAFAAKRNVAQQHQASVLAIDLARMNTRLDQQHGLLCSPWLASNDRNHVTALRRSTEGFDAQQW